MTQFPFEIPCPHKVDPSIPNSTKLSDYHSLTMQEIASLLDFAKCHKREVQVVSKVQVRLNQGIHGYTCPRTTSGEVARRSVELDRIFVDQYKFGGTPSLVKAIESCMRE